MVCGIDGAIQRVAGNFYHSQAAKAMPLINLQTIVAKGNKYQHRGQFNNVVFVVDDLKSPLNKVVYTSLETASNEGYQHILVPTIRMGVMNGIVEKTPEEAISKMALGITEFLEKYAKKTRLTEIGLVVYNNPSLAQQLGNVLKEI